MFNVGQEVVVVDDSPGQVSKEKCPFRKNDVVTIKEAGIVPAGVPYVRLVEYRCRVPWGWSADRFAPLISNEDLQEEINECIVEELEFI